MFAPRSGPPISLSLLFLLFSLLAPAAVLAVDVDPVCDIAVDSRYPTYSVPNDARLRIGDLSPGNGIDEPAYGYLKFDLGDAIPAGAYPVYATLRVHQAGVYEPPFHVGVYYVEDDNWDCDMTWNTAPMPDSGPIDVQLIPEGAPYEYYVWEITDDVVHAWEDDKFYTAVMIHEEIATNSDWISKDGTSNKPYLTVGIEWGRDWGDAPDPTYPTLAASNGAYHTLESGPRLGALVDYEPDAHASSDAQGDDTNSVLFLDDEDGVTLPEMLIAGATQEVLVEADGPGFLSAWIDFDGDGSWSEAGDQIFSSTPVTAGVNMLAFTVPAGSRGGLTFARFRIRPTSFPMLSFDGPCEGGEVEDYQVLVGESDWGDAMDPTFPTLAANNGAMHLLVTGPWLGTTVDHEPDGQPDVWARGDDNDGSDDEDGVIFKSRLLPGRTTDLDVVVSQPCKLDAWLDFDGDGSWDSPRDQIFASVDLAETTTTLTFAVPDDAPNDLLAYARFRVSTAGGLAPDGLALDGEVEDYCVRISVMDDKWGQNPDLDVDPTDVEMNVPYILADQFTCTEENVLIEIDVWGSYRNGSEGWNQDTFTLSIQEDSEPAGEPANTLWMKSFVPGEYLVEPVASGQGGTWLLPFGQTLSHDWDCVKLRFLIDPAEAFVQSGSEEEPVTYWFSVQNDGASSDAFGWRNSVDPEPWDGSKFCYGSVPGAGPWLDLLYPVGSTYAGQNMNLAFSVISSHVAGVPDAVDLRAGLRPNFPNPFNPATTIGYVVPAGGARVTLEVFDLRGRLVATLVNGSQAEGRQTVVWRGTDVHGRQVPSGIYFYRMTADELVDTRKMLLMK